MTETDPREFEIRVLAEWADLLGTPISRLKADFDELIDEERRLRGHLTNEELRDRALRRVRIRVHREMEDRLRLEWRSRQPPTAACPPWRSWDRSVLWACGCVLVRCPKHNEHRVRFCPEHETAEVQEHR